MNQNEVASANMVIQKTIESLEATGDFKVLKRFVPQNTYAPIDLIHGPIKTAMILDTETTSLDPKSGKIIELGYLLVEFDSVSGEIHNVTGRYSGFEDPGHPLSEETTAITGIVDADVAGQKFDDVRIEEDIAKASICIAYNSSFDRNFMECRFPSVTNKWWGCAMKEAPWKEMGCGSLQLEFVAFFVAGIFYEAHRATVDAGVTLHVLTQQAHDHRPVMLHLLETSRKPSYRVWATDSPFDTKDILKKNGYRWSDGSDPDYPIKAWHKEVIDLEAEKAWLATDIYSRRGKITVDTISGRERFTPRSVTRDQVILTPEPKTEPALSEAPQPA